MSIFYTFQDDFFLLQFLLLDQYRHIFFQSLWRFVSKYIFCIFVHLLFLFGLLGKFIHQHQEDNFHFFSYQWLPEFSTVCLLRFSALLSKHYPQLFARNQRFHPAIFLILQTVLLGLFKFSQKHAEK